MHKGKVFNGGSIKKGESTEGTLLFPEEIFSEAIINDQ